MRSVNSRKVLRQIGWLMFWSTAVAAALFVLLFLWVAVPAWLTIANGGPGHLWLFGEAGFVLVTAVAYLAVAVVVIVRRRIRAGNGVDTRRGHP